jgi:hypothetical protein
MPSFREVFAPTLDAIRSGVPTAFGLRTVTLTVRLKTWSQNGVTKGTKTVVDTPIVGPGGNRYKVREVTSKDVVLSGGRYQAGTYKVGPITPPYAGGTYTAADLIPPKVAGQGREVYYGVTDASGVTQWCSMEGSDTMHDLHWFLFLKPSGVQDP